MSVSKALSRVANESKKLKKGGDPAALLEARKALAAEKLEIYIRTVVASAPPLDEVTKARLALLLSGA